MNSIQSTPLPNTLSEKEKEDGWMLLFDGKTTNGWKGAYKDQFPSGGWKVANGCLIVLESGGKESNNGGDIVTVDEYADFELIADFKITSGANSGIKYFVVEYQPKPEGSAHGLEFQILDDAKHPDAKLGREGNRTVGSLYDLIAARNKKVNPIGAWNTARIMCKGSHVEHWLNDIKVVEYERGSEKFRELVSKSKYADASYNKNGRFGEAPKGHILLQDHGDEVAFRNIKIRRI